VSLFFVTCILTLMQSGRKRLGIWESDNDRGIMNKRIFNATALDNTVDISIGLDVDKAEVKGSVRLWYDSDPPVRTDKVILVTGKELNTEGEAVKLADDATIESKINAIFIRSQASLDDYGPKERRGFHCDIQLPKSVIDGYTE